MNHIGITGLISKLESKTTGNNASFVSFSVAVDRGYKAQDGKYPTDFLPCVAWRQTAEFISKYFEVGSGIELEGSLQSRQYEDQDGKKRTVFEINVTSVGFVKAGKKKVNQANGSSPTHPVQEVFVTAESEEVLPFDV